MIKVNKITKDGKEFRAITGDVFSANDNFKAMICIEATDEHWDMFKDCCGAVVTCSVLGQRIDIEAEYGESVEGSDSYILLYVGSDNV